MLGRLARLALMLFLTTTWSPAGAWLPAVLPAQFGSPAVAKGPATTEPPALPGWVDSMVRSRGVLCASSVTGDVMTSGGKLLTQHVACTSSMTDPRVSGRRSADITVTFEPTAKAAGHWEGTFTITNDHGAWTGTGRGAAVRAAGADRELAMYGKNVYQGSGAFRGLTYTELIVWGDQPTVLSGWISGPQDPIILI